MSASQFRFFRFGFSVFALLVPMCALSTWTPAAFAQAGYASIHGTVTDSSGAVIPSAQVTILNTSTGAAATAVSDKSGYYVVPQLRIGGPYTVSVSASGFQKFAATGITLNLDDNRDVDAKMTIGAAAQTVEVQGSPVQVETSETQLKTDISSEQIEQLPLLGRDASQLEKYAPGVGESSDRFGTFTANGSQTSQSDYLLDGADINDGPLQSLGIAVNPDALSQEGFVGSTLNPEYARNSGEVINQTLKTGTNSLHGSGFWYYRDTFLNNGNYFSQTRPQFHQNLYGGTVGGPIYRDKLFFFLAYQGYRNRTGTTQQTPVFSPSQIAGDFSADTNIANGAPNSAGLSSNPIPFPIAGCAAMTPWNACPAIATGQIPTTAYNPLAVKLFNQYVPAANNVIVNPSTGQSSYLYNFNTADSAGSDQGVIRIDYHFSPKDTVWASSIFQSNPDVQTLPFGGATVPGFAQVDASHIKIFNADYIHTFNATSLNEFRVGYFRFNYAAVSPQTPTQPSSVGFNISPQSPEAGLPNIGLTGYFTLGFSFEGPQPRKDTNLTGADTFTKIVGNHSLKFGVLYEQFQVNNPYYADNNGVFAFPGSGGFSSGDPAIDFLLGIPGSYTQQSGSIIDAHSAEYYAFAQDGWKITPDLTLNYGVSWDVETPWANHQFGGEGITCWQNSSATSSIYPGGAPGLLYPGDPGCSTYGEATVKWPRFGPRFGFAWSPSSGPSRLIGEPGAHTFAIRGGFGLYYNRDQEEESLQNLSSPPYNLTSRGAADLSLANGTPLSPGFQDPFTDVAGRGSEANRFPYTVPPRGSALNWANYTGLDISNVSAKWNVPYTYNFNLNIQRQIPGNMVAQIGYVGSISHNLPRVAEGDQITAAGHAACLSDPTGTCQANGAYLHALYPQYAAQPATNPTTGVPWYLSVGQQVNDGASSYNSLQASLEKALSHGLYFRLGYTYSHALDDGSGYESTSATSSPNGIGLSNGRTINSIPGFGYLNYGDSDFDFRHRFTAIYVYEIPLLASMRQNRLVNEAIGGWHVSGTTALQTGFPVTLSQSGSYLSLWCDGYSYYGCPDNPNATSFNVKSLNPRNAGNLWFNTSNFTSEALGTFGNTPRNFFHGPGYNYTNLQVFKNFPLGRSETRALQVRLESYNVFNHPNFAQPDGDYSDSTFGSVLSVIQPASFGGGATDPQPGRATQLSVRLSF